MDPPINCQLLVERDFHRHVALWLRGSELEDWKIPRYRDASSKEYWISPSFKVGTPHFLSGLPLYNEIGLKMFKSPGAKRPIWLWVKTRYPKWNPGRISNLRPLGFHFDPYPCRLEANHHPRRKRTAESRVLAPAGAAELRFRLHLEAKPRAAAPRARARAEPRRAVNTKNPRLSRSLSRGFSLGRCPGAKKGPPQL